MSQTKVTVELTLLDNSILTCITEPSADTLIGLVLFSLLEFYMHKIVEYTHVQKNRLLALAVLVD